MGAYERIPANTFRTMQMDAGILCEGFDPATGEFEKIIGATNGGVTIEATPEYKDQGENIDNCPKNMLELKTIEGWTCKISGTYVNASAQMIRNLLGSASLNDNHITIRNKLTEDDFKDIWWIGDYGESGYYAVKLSKAINTKGLSQKSQKDGNGTWEFEYNGHYSINNQDEVPLEIYMKDTVERHIVDYTLNGVKSYSSPHEVVNGGTLLATFEPNTGYTLPSTVTVKVNGTTKTAGTDYTWDNSTGVLKIKPETTIGDILVEITGNKETYTVTYTLENVSKTSGETSIEYGNDLNAAFSGAEGYDLPSAITVTVKGTGLNNNRYTWNSTTGVLKISKDEVRGNIVVTITGVSQ